jgi:SAM-dependent methyltransferase
LANFPSQRLANWFSTPHGERLIREESVALGEAARRFHGDTLLWVGCHGATTETVRGCMVRHRFFASEVPGQAPEEMSSLTCHLEALPLPNSSIDAMVLHHSLEMATDPRAALREAARVLVPGARLVLCAFNPFSLWGMRTAYATVREDSFTGLRTVNTIRLIDWLTLLGFELQAEIKYLAYGLPFAAGKQEAPGRVRSFITRLQPPIGGVYVISVTKQAMARRGVGREVRMPSPKLIPVAYPKSSASRSASVFELRRPRSDGRPIAAISRLRSTDRGKPPAGSSGRDPVDQT